VGGYDAHSLHRRGQSHRCDGSGYERLVYGLAPGAARSRTGDAYLRHTIARLRLERGRAKAQDSQQVATALNSYCPGRDRRGIVLVGQAWGRCSLNTTPAHIHSSGGLVLVDSVHPARRRSCKDVRDKYEGDLKTLTDLTRVFAPTGLLRLAAKPSPDRDKLPARIRDMVRAIGYQSMHIAPGCGMAAFQQSQAQVQQLPAARRYPLATIRATTVEIYPRDAPRYGSIPSGTRCRAIERISDPAAGRRAHSGHFVTSTSRSLSEDGPRNRQHGSRELTPSQKARHVRPIQFLAVGVRDF
jgi:hypothetical protein